MFLASGYLVKYESGFPPQSLHWGLKWDPASQGNTYPVHSIIPRQLITVSKLIDFLHSGGDYQHEVGNITPLFFFCQIYVELRKYTHCVWAGDT